MKNKKYNCWLKLSKKGDESTHCDWKESNKRETFVTNLVWFVDEDEVEEEDMID